MIGHVAGTRAKIGLAMWKADLNHMRSGLGFVVVGRTGFEPVTSSVSGKRSPTELTARVPRRDATRARTSLRDTSSDTDHASPVQAGAPTPLIQRQRRELRYVPSK
jgi:hypothetical protein